MKRQRGNVTVYAIAAALLIASVIGWGEVRFAAGVEKERARNFAAVVQHDNEMSGLRRKHADELEILIANAAAQSRTNAARIQKLLRENKVLSDWWNSPIPAPAISYAWVRPGPSDSEVRSGPEPAPTNPSPSAAGESH